MFGNLHLHIYIYYIYIHMFTYIYIYINTYIYIYTYVFIYILQYMICIFIHGLWLCEVEAWLLDEWSQPLDELFGFPGLLSLCCAADSMPAGDCQVLPGWCDHLRQKKCSYGPFKTSYNSYNRL